MRPLALLTLCLLLSCSGALAQSSSSDTLAPSPDPLVALLPGALYAVYPLHHSDMAIRTTRHHLLGAQWRHRYDDHMQFASYALQLAMRCGGATGRSRSWGEMLTADGIGIGYDRAASERTYAHLQAGLEALPRLRYLDRLGLFLRLHCEPYRQSYLTLGLSLRHPCW